MHRKNSQLNVTNVTVKIKILNFKIFEKKGFFTVTVLKC
jgi:hypothetical protein